MSQLRSRLYRWTRDKSLIIRVSVAILALGGVLGFLLSLLGSGLTVPSHRERLLFDKNFLQSLPGRGNVEEVAMLVRGARPLSERLRIHVRDRRADGEDQSPLPAASGAFSAKPGLAWAGAVIDHSTLPAAEKELLRLLNRGLHGEGSEAAGALAELERRAALENAPRHVQAFLGDVLATDEETAKAAVDAYRAEMRHHRTGSYEPEEIARLLLASEDPGALAELLSDAPVLAHVSSTTLSDIASRARDIPLLLRAVWRMDYGSIPATIVFLVLLSGTIWAVVLGLFIKLDQRRLALFGAALVLGVLSATATLFAAILQDDWSTFGGRQEGELLDQAIYWICGVGLREEVIKLLFFVPLLPFLRKRAPLEAFLAASYVGLGFAIQENVGYYHSPLVGTVAWTRLFTANFLHLALTGLAGLALRDMAARPSRWQPFVEKLLLVALLHGGYNLLIAVAPFGDASAWFQIAVMAFIATRYFHELNALHITVPGQPVSPLGWFVVMSTVLLAASFCIACRDMPFLAAVNLVGASSLSTAIIAFLYINQFKQH